MWETRFHRVLAVVCLALLAPRPACGVDSQAGASSAVGPSERLEHAFLDELLDPDQSAPLHNPNLAGQWQVSLPSAPPCGQQSQVAPIIVVWQAARSRLSGRRPELLLLFSGSSWAMVLQKVLTDGSGKAIQPVGVTLQCDKDTPIVTSWATRGDQDKLILRCDDDVLSQLLDHRWLTIHVDRGKAKPAAVMFDLRQLDAVFRSIAPSHGEFAPPGWKR